MKFSCFKCGQHLAAEPDMIGRQIDCPNCSAKITVVAETAAAPATPAKKPPIKFSCFKCGQHLAAEPDMVGRQIECPACASKITVVGESPVEPVAALVTTPPVRPSTPTPPSPAKPPAAASTTTAPVQTPAAPAKPAAPIQPPAARPGAVSSSAAAPAAKSAAPSSAASAPINKPAAPATKPATSSANQPTTPASKPAAPTNPSAAPASKPAAPANKPSAPAYRPPAPKYKADVPARKPAATKSRAPLVAMVTVLVLALVGGGWYLLRHQKGKPRTVKEPSITGKPSDPAVDLFAAWKAGQRYQLSLEMSQTTGYRVRTNNSALETAFAQEYTLSVSNTPERNRALELEIVSFTLETTSGGRRVINFDSLNKFAPSDGNPVAVSLSKLVGGRVRYLLAPDNKILQTDGVKELLARTVTAADATTPATGTRGSSLARRHFNTEGLRQMIEVGGAPSTPMRIGQTWVAERDINAGIIGTFRLTTTNTFAGWQEHEKKKCARINITGTFNSIITRSTNSLVATGSMKIANGKVTGKSWFDPKLGVVIETVLDQDFDAPVIVPPSRRGTKSGAAPVTYNPAHQTLSIKLNDVSPLSGP